MLRGGQWWRPVPLDHCRNAGCSDVTVLAEPIGCQTVVIAGSLGNAVQKSDGQRRQAGGRIGVEQLDGHVRGRSVSAVVQLDVHAIDVASLRVAMLQRRLEGEVVHCRDGHLVVGWRAFERIHLDVRAHPVILRIPEVHVLQRILERRRDGLWRGEYPCARHEVIAHEEIHGRHACHVELALPQATAVRAALSSRDGWCSRRSNTAAFGSPSLNCVQVAPPEVVRKTATSVAIYIVVAAD